MIFLFSRTLWFREKNPTLKNNRFTYTGSCIFFWLLFFALKHSNSYSHNIWWNISMGLWLLRSFQIVSSWRGRMVQCRFPSSGCQFLFPGKPVCLPRTGHSGGLKIQYRNIFIVQVVCGKWIIWVSVDPSIHIYMYF